MPWATEQEVKPAGSHAEGDGVDLMRGEEVMKTLYLCGAGNSEGVRLALAINRNQPRWDDIVLLDDDPGKHGRVMLGVEIAGSIETLNGVDPGKAEVANLVARTTDKRRLVRDRLAGFGIPFAQLLSPEIDTLGVELAGDVMAYQNAILGPEVTIDEGTVVFMGGIVGHESIVGKCCVIAANAVLNARVRLEDRVYFGTNATALPEVTIGEGATVGAGSVVIQDVPPGATAIGVPAQIMTIAPSSQAPMHNGEMISQVSANQDNAKPAPEVERLIARIWGDVLHLDSVGVEQTFFDLGGDSLLALRVCERLKQETGSNLCIMDVFHYPTVRALAGRFQQDTSGHQEPTVDHSRASRRRAMMQRRNVSQY